VAALRPPIVEWSWRPTPVANSQVGLPLVARIVDHDGDGDVDGDDPPDVIVAFDDFALDGAALHAFDGRTGAILWTSPVRAHDHWQPAAGDLDGVPGSEVVLIDASGWLACLDGTTGELRWRNESIALERGALHVSLANVDQAGAPEIVAGRSVFDAQGNELFTLLSDVDLDTNGRVETVPVELLPRRDGLELLIGNVLWGADGAAIWELGLRAPWPNRPRPGYVAVADLDLDGRPEILVANRLPPAQSTTGTPTLDVRDDAGNDLGRFAVPPGGQVAAPVVANVDDDPEPEILLAAATRLFALQWIGGTSPWVVQWSVPTQDASCCSRPSAFDLDGDGLAEVLYSDEVRVLVVDGRTGSVLHEEPWDSGTRWESPVVANLDDDPEAEVLLAGTALLRVLEWPGSASPRCAWNELAYHDVNVRDDGTLPVREPPAWLDGGTWGSQVAGPCAGGGQCRSCEDLLATIDAADVDDAGIRQSLRAKAEQACRLAEHPRAASPAHQLCALLRELAAQRRRHVTEEAAIVVEDCVRPGAAARDLSLARGDPGGRRPALGARGDSGEDGRRDGSRRR
jgi:hypothetical protein